MSNQLTLLDRAARIMALAHGSQVRKTDGSPYVAHAAVVGLSLARAGFPEAVVAAGLVHDVLDDASYSREDLTKELGEEVASIVFEVSEGASDASTWEQRKLAYVQAIKNGSVAAKAVSVCDKIHNLQSILHGYAQQGPTLWGKFNRGREQQMWLFEQLLPAYQHGWQHPLIEEYAELVAQLRGLS
jgi:(p)ppGpp synthase/HD superfamily hydrolase